MNWTEMDVTFTGTEGEHRPKPKKKAQRSSHDDDDMDDFRQTHVPLHSYFSDCPAVFNSLVGFVQVLPQDARVRRGEDEVLYHPLDATRIHPDDYDRAVEICFSTLRYAAVDKHGDAHVKTKWASRERARKTPNDIRFRTGVIAATMNSAMKHAAEFMKAACPGYYLPWDPYFGYPEDTLFTLILKDYDELLFRKVTGKKQYHLLCNIQAELVEPFR
jgi:hypothetical protein